MAGLLRWKKFSDGVRSCGCEGNSNGPAAVVTAHSIASGELIESKARLCGEQGDYPFPAPHLFLFVSSGLRGAVERISGLFAGHGRDSVHAGSGLACDLGGEIAVRA